MKYAIIEVFDFGEYRLLDVKNKVVVDVGAAYGDSTMYFLLRGAKSYCC
jgi:predicted rRNA methylase YqxC with S4 and FtsJ domains